MCTYCMMGDNAFRYDQPWEQQDPRIPKPYKWGPVNPWPLDRLVDFADLLRRVKALEDALGCPCEPNKVDYIKLFEERIAVLEKQLEAKP